MDESKMPSDPAARLELALRAMLSQSRPPQDLHRLIASALRCAADEGFAAAVHLIEADVIASRASND